ncbi:MAG: hypothetical protein M3498_09370 [Deinococcota bacterium]|jgi:Zn ribbon nucleic-acid-binding protein|nr:hypothetical protein [Deinococcota bacterium]
MSWDAEGLEQGDICPECGSADTVTYEFSEGYSELECRCCGYATEQSDIAALTRYRGDLLEGGALPPVPVKKLKA